MVRGKQARSDGVHRPHPRPGDERPPLAVYSGRGIVAESAAARARPRGDALPVRRAQLVALSPGAPVQFGDRRPLVVRRLRAGRVDDGTFRRQFQLARTGLVPAQLLAHRGPVPLQPVLRRRAQGGTPGRRGAHGLAVRSRRRPFPAAGLTVPGGPRRAPAGTRPEPLVTGGRPLERSPVVPRVLQR